MSFLKQRGKKGTWYYISNEGAWKSLKTQSRLVAEQLKTRLDDRGMRSKYGIPDQELSWEEFRNEYFDLYAPLHAAASLVKLKIAVAAFERIVKPTMLIGVQARDIERWQAVRVTEISHRSVDAEQKYLAPMFRKAHGRRYIEVNPFIDIHRLKFTVPEPRSLSLGEAGKFLDMARKHFPEHELLALFAYETGMRLGEIVHQRIEDIDFMRALIQVKPHNDLCQCYHCAKQERAGWTGKAGVPRTVPISPRLNSLILQIFQQRPQGCLFPMAPNTLIGIFQRIYKKAGMKEAQSCTHTFRHTLATDMERAGVRRAVIKVILGHSKSTTTDSYIHVNLDELRGEFTKLLEWRDGGKQGIALSIT